MGHILDVRVFSNSARFWNYVYADGRMMGKRVSNSWENAAMQIDCDSVDEKLLVEGFADELEGEYWYVSEDVQYSTRGGGTGWSKEYFLDASRACPDAEIIIFELFLDGAYELERTCLQDGRIIGHYFVTPETDMELFSEMADEVFGLDADQLSLDEGEDSE